MSALPVYIWCPAHFERPHTMLPASLDEAQTLVNTWQDQPPPAGASGEVFLRLAAHLFEATQSPGYSDRFVACYQDIEMELSTLAARRAVIEVPEDGTYDELLPLLVDHHRACGLVVYDSHGKIWLPDGRAIPEDDELMMLPTDWRPLAMAY
ncbi:MAG: hypothetical protein Q4D91_00230 [Lautropia sp.]|nr:hypothetical protein [Lautropia sp.]